MFEEQLNLIKHEEIKSIAEQGVKLIPEYFYHVPASSSGKYHPAYASGDGGLYRHVIVAVSIAKELFTIHDFNEYEQDIILTALILHDGWKQGLDGSGGKTLFDHPLVASEVLKEKVVVSSEIDASNLDLICGNIKSHMGQWNTSKYDTAVLPTPQTDMQKFVHLCDYLASRKKLEFNFSA